MTCNLQCTLGCWKSLLLELRCYVVVYSKLHRDLVWFGRSGLLYSEHTATKNHPDSPGKENILGRQAFGLAQSPTLLVHLAARFGFEALCVQLAIPGKLELDMIQATSLDKHKHCWTCSTAGQCFSPNCNLVAPALTLHGNGGTSWRPHLFEHFEFYNKNWDFICSRNLTASTGPLQNRSSELCKLGGYGSVPFDWIRLHAIAVAVFCFNRRIT